MVQVISMISHLATLALASSFMAFIASAQTGDGTVEFFLDYNCSNPNQTVDRIRMLQEKLEGSDDYNHTSSTRMHSTLVMESDIGDLAQYLVDQLDSLQLPEPRRRLLVGISESGIPGPASGKTTFAQILTERINHILNQPRTQDIERPQAILVGLDGWHLTRAQLDVFPDPLAAHDRRGSHWTFDGASYVSFVRALRDGASVINAPSFDHALKDPIPDAVSIYPYHRIVIIEGLYVFLAIKPWSEGGLLLDERWFI
jgi:pantothenate kinase